MFLPKDIQPGMIKDSFAYGKFVIIQYFSRDKVKVRFLKTGTVKCFRAHSIRSGQIKDPMMPKVFGVGYIGVGRYKAQSNGVKTIHHKTWVKMLERCYSKKYQERFPSYEGCTVCSEWHNFQTFAEWLDQKEIPDGRWALDKDILVDGNKEYGPSTCKIVTAQENTEKACAKNYVFLNPKGERVEIYNLRRFCRENSMQRSEMAKVATGNRKSYNGWTLIGGSENG